MRDIKRIPDILKRIQKVWEENSDLRLGQLLLNAFSLHNGVDGTVYRMEDDNFVNNLELFYKRKEK